MTKRRFNLPNNVSAVNPCGKCGQKKQFTCKSKQVSEDSCEVWIECICGHDPHGISERMVSVMGGCDEGNIYSALDCWNDASGNKRVPHPPGSLKN